MNVTSTAIEGLNRAEEKLQSVASKLARVSDTNSAPEDTVDLSAEMIALIEARNEHAVNVKVLETANDIERHMLDVLA